MVPRPVADARPRPEVPESIRRLLGLRTRASLRAVAASRPPDRHLPGDEIAPGLRYLESQHESPTLPDVLDVSFAKNFDTVSPSQLLCFDTETTGLAGGTGTRAFMIGCADRVDGQLRIRQLMTTTMAAEHAMLEVFAGWLQPDTVLVSYNGRSYDAPLLKTRYRLARMPCPITPLAHLDLLHPVRRRYRGLWENCRLATVERQLLKVLREDDLPGSEAPRAWRDYLNGGPATDLRRVLAHNHTDVRSLMQLLARLAANEASTIPPCPSRSRT
nr:ribonuclease H-like domain-containing protein [Arenimonas soli]